MFCIHTISFLCRVPKRDAEISGYVMQIRAVLDQVACQLRTVNIQTKNGCWRSLKHLKTYRLNQGACFFKQAAEENATQYGIRRLPIMSEGSRHSFPSYAETDRSMLFCTHIC